MHHFSSSNNPLNNSQTQLALRTVYNSFYDKHHFLGLRQSPRDHLYHLNISTTGNGLRRAMSISIISNGRQCTVSFFISTTTMWIHLLHLLLRTHVGLCMELSLFHHVIHCAAIYERKYRCAFSYAMTLNPSYSRRSACLSI